MLEDLKKLALEAIRIKTRIKADTEKLQEIKNQVVEKSKDRYLATLHFAHLIMFTFTIFSPTT